MSFWIVPRSFVAGRRPAPRRRARRAAAAARRRVDRHRRRDLVERDAVEQAAHVLDRVDRDADLADLALARGSSES
jgi:hypothetical protein